MPAASLMRLASSAFSMKTARSRAQRAAARGLPVDGAVRPRHAIRAGLGQTTRVTRATLAFAGGPAPSRGA